MAWWNNPAQGYGAGGGMGGQGDTSQVIQEYQSYAAERARAAASEGPNFPGASYAGASLEGVSGYQFGSVLQEAEAYAAASGGQIPPFWAIRNISRQLGHTHQNVWEQFYNLMSPERQAAMPWLKYGYDQDTYYKRIESYNDTMLSMIGRTMDQALFPTQFEWIMKHEWSPARLQQFLKTDPVAAQVYPYLKYGHTYTSFQQYRVEHAQEVGQRFGYWTDNPSQIPDPTTNLNNDPFVKNLADPLIAYHASAGAVDTRQQTQNVQNITGTAVR